MNTYKKISRKVYPSDLNQILIKIFQLNLISNSAYFLLLAGLVNVFIAFSGKGF